MIIIGLCGAQGAGKDTVGEILINEYGFHKLSFASALKDMLAALFSWPRELLEGDTEESRICFNKNSSGKFNILESISGLKG